MRLDHASNEMCSRVIEEIAAKVADAKARVRPRAGRRTADHRQLRVQDVLRAFARGGELHRGGGAGEIQEPPRGTVIDGDIGVRYAQRQRLVRSGEVPVAGPPGGVDGAERAQRLGPRFERHLVDVERLVAAIRAIQHIGEDVEQAQMVDGEILARLPERFQRRVGGGDRVVATVQGAQDQTEIGVAGRICRFEFNGESEAGFGFGQRTLAAQHVAKLVVDRGEIRPHRQCKPHMPLGGREFGLLGQDAAALEVGGRIARRDC